MVAAFILDQTGFVANIVQNIDVQNGLKAMMSTIPVAVGTVALIILVFFYKLDEPTMKKIKADMDLRRKESSN
jgi:Na+/melibiose symporter-like transporter